MKKSNLLNQLKMNGVIIEPTPKAIMTNALEMMIDDFKYRSKENLIETLTGIQGLVIDWLQANGKKGGRHLKEQKILQHRGKHMTRTEVVSFAYNSLLRWEALGTLNGFGISNNFKDNLLGNPEKISIVHTN